MRTTIGIFILLATMALARTVHSQVLETNPAASRIAATTSPAADHDPLLPLVEMHDVPITAAIANLARQSEMNYIFDPKLFASTDASGNPLAEPEVNFRLQNVSAREVLNRMLNVRNLVMTEDPVTRVTRITRRNQPTNVVEASLLGVDTKHPAPATNEIVPLMQFSEVPLVTALENLIRQSQVDVVLDSRITGASDPRDGLPTLSLRWEKISAKQAIIALCQNYDLVIVQDTATGGLRIEPKSKVKK
jgi:hypothetical protein